MKKLLLFLLPLVVLADSFIIQSEEVSKHGKTYWLITACKDGYRYTIIKDEPLEYLVITQDFELIKGKSIPVKCPDDFKSPQQLAQ